MSSGTAAFARMLAETIQAYLANHNRLEEDAWSRLAAAMHLLQPIYRPELPPPVPVDEQTPADEASE